MRTSLAVILGIILVGGCAASDEIVSIQVHRLDIPAEARNVNGAWRLDEKDTAVAALAQALRSCGRREMVQFRPKYRIVAARRDGTSATFLILGEYAKVEGMAFKCAEDVEALVDRLWGEGAGPPQRDG